jgi:hypothetical protein
LCDRQEKTEQLCVLLSQVEGLYDSIKDCPFEPLALLAVMQVIPHHHLADTPFL